MKVLVIDDNPVHLAAAKAQLKDHELTVAGSYDEGQGLLNANRDEDKFQQLLKERGLKQELGMSEENRKDLCQASDDSMVPFRYEAVLVDLLMPASAQSMGRNTRLVGQEMPVGIFLALFAATRGAKYVAVFTDSDHHSHPASACFDVFNMEGEGRPVPFIVASARVILANNRNWVAPFYKDDLSRRASYGDLFEDEKKEVRLITNAKNWARLLEYLLDPSSEEKDE